MKNPIIACVMVMLLLATAAGSSYASFILYNTGYYNLSIVVGIFAVILMFVFIHSISQVVDGATSK